MAQRNPSLRQRKPNPAESGWGLATGVTNNRPMPQAPSRQTIKDETRLHERQAEKQPPRFEAQPQKQFASMYNRSMQNRDLAPRQEPPKEVTENYWGEREFRTSQPNRSTMLRQNGATDTSPVRMSQYQKGGAPLRSKVKQPSFSEQQPFKPESRPQIEPPPENEGQEPHSQIPDTQQQHMAPFDGSVDQVDQGENCNPDHPDDEAQHAEQVDEPSQTGTCLSEMNCIRKDEQSIRVDLDVTDDSALKAQMADLSPLPKDAQDDATKEDKAEGSQAEMFKEIIRQMSSEFEKLGIDPFEVISQDDAALKAALAQVLENKQEESPLQGGPPLEGGETKQATDPAQAAQDAAQQQQDGGDADPQPQAKEPNQLPHFGQPVNSVKGPPRQNQIGQPDAQRMPDERRFAHPPHHARNFSPPVVPHLDLEVLNDPPKQQAQTPHEQPIPAPQKEGNQVGGDFWQQQQNLFAKKIQDQPVTRGGQAGIQPYGRDPSGRVAFGQQPGRPLQNRPSAYFPAQKAQQPGPRKYSPNEDHEKAMYPEGRNPHQVKQAVGPQARAGMPRHAPQHFPRRDTSADRPAYEKSPRHTGWEPAPHRSQPKFHRPVGSNSSAGIETSFLQQYNKAMKSTQKTKVSGGEHPWA